MIAAGSARDRLVLAALGVEAGRAVPVDVLVDRLWGAEAPARERRALHAYVSRARRMVAHLPGPAAIERSSAGYALRLDPLHVDLHAFRWLVSQAREASCPPDRRVALLRQAVGLWRGEPLMGLSGVWCARMRESWQRERTSGVVAWADAELAAGDPEGVVDTLADLAAGHPLNELLAGALMRVLAALGRRTEALETFERLRIGLVEELGIDPGPQVLEAHRAVLDDRPDAAIAAGPPLPGPGQPVVAQLPAALAVFAGREAELAFLDELADRAAGTAAPEVVVLSGTAGVGKTTLAVRWAHQVKDRFPNGQLYVNLRGFDPDGAMGPADALHALLEGLRLPAAQIPTDVDAQVALYRGQLAGRRMLVVLDNARDHNQVAAVLPGTPGSLTLITSRNPLASLVVSAGARSLAIGLMSPGEAIDLLARRLGRSRVDAEPGAVHDIIAQCARLPLALGIAAAHAATHPGSALAVTAARLAETASTLDVMDGGDRLTDLRSVFSWSYRCLSDPAARLFRLLGLHPGPDIDLPDAGSLAAIPVSGARGLLAELMRAGLIAEHRPGRYAFHDLLRAYAVEQVEKVDSDDERRGATQRMLDHYIHTAHTAAMLLKTGSEPPDPDPPQPGVVRVVLANDHQAANWFAAKQAVLLAVIDRAVAIGLDRYAWQLAWTLLCFLSWAGHRQDVLLASTWSSPSSVASAGPRRLTPSWLSPSAAGTPQAAVRLNNRGIEVRVWRHLARACLRLNRLDDAHAHARRALDVTVETGDRIEEARTHHLLANILEWQGRHAEALGHAAGALRLYREAGSRFGEAHALNAVGWYHGMLGDYHEALRHCEEACKLLEDLDDRAGQASVWDCLGVIHHQLEHLDRAIECYEHALDLYRELGERFFEADTLGHLGDTLERAGQPDAARSVWARALDLLQSLDHPDADQVRAKLFP